MADKPHPLDEHALEYDREDRTITLGGAILATANPAADFPCRDDDRTDVDQDRETDDLLAEIVGRANAVRVQKGLDRCFTDLRPMTRAPHDGRHVLLQLEERALKPAAAFWIGDGLVVASWTVDPEDGGWFICTDPTDLSQGRGLFFDAHFTGWKPLPLPDRLHHVTAALTDVAAEASAHG